MWILNYGLRIADFGLRIADLGLRIADFAAWIGRVDAPPDAIGPTRRPMSAGDGDHRPAGRCDPETPVRSGNAAAERGCSRFSRNVT